MKIMFVLPETPKIGGGGIATYLAHARSAFEDEGHQVYSFSWVFREDRDYFLNLEPNDIDRVIAISGRDVWKAYPDGPFQVALSYFLLPRIREFALEIQPDVIETSDFKAPLYAFLAERRAGRLPDLESIPVVGFNHGLTRLLYSTNGVLPQPHAQQELAAERQATRWCDLVLVPSHSALGHLEYQTGRLDNAVVISEPYKWEGNEAPAFRAAPNFYHLGRVSFSKGIDHEIHFLNAFAAIKSLESITFIGTHDHIPFSESTAEGYIRKRVAPKLQDRLRFLGQVDRDEFGKIFSPGGYSMNFSNQETFNYAFVEMVTHGLFPFAKAGTPMEEFVPDSLRHLVLPSDFDLRNLETIVREIERDGLLYQRQIIEHVKKMTDPSHFVRAYETALTQRRRALGVSRAQLGSPFRGQDVTVLMATYNNSEVIKETIASIKAQSVTPAQIIIVDDGSTEKAALRTLEQLGDDPRIRVVRSRINEGLCASRVKLIELSDTELSLFVDSDDLLQADYLSKTLAAMNSSRIVPDAVFTWRQNFEMSQELLINDLMGDHYQNMRNEFRMTALIRTSVLKNLGFTSSMRNGEADDWVFWLKFANEGYHSVMVGEPLFLYRFAEGSMSWPWSEGQATLTGREIARLWVKQQNGLPGQAIEDLYCERVWHMMQQPTAEREEEVSGETFVALYRVMKRLRQSQPRLFAFAQKMGRPLVRCLGRSRS